LSIEENKQIALGFLEGLTKQGYSVFNDPKFVTEDFHWWIQGRGTFSGPEMVARCAPVEAMMAGPSRRTIKGITAEGDRVAIEYEGDSPMKNGKRYQNTYHCLYVIRDGRLASGKEYLDTAYIRETLIP
jgi:ketosteroid isomerase-like protein